MIYYHSYNKLTPKKSQSRKQNYNYNYNYKNHSSIFAATNFTELIFKIEPAEIL